MNSEPIYYPDDKYTALATALANACAIASSILNIELSAWTGTVTDNEVKIALGEHFDIWPDAIFPHVEPG